MHPTRNYLPKFLVDLPLYRSVPLNQASSLLIADPNVRNCTVSTLTHGKQKQHPYHEFLLATIVIDCNGKACYMPIRIERWAQDEDLPKLNSLMGRATPRDVVSSPRRSGCSFEIVEKLTFSKTCLPLDQFSRLLSLVTDVGKDYQILKHQCYWFCWIIKQASMDLWGGIVTAESAKRRDGVFGVGISRSQLGRDPGSLVELLRVYRSLPLEAVIIGQAVIQSDRESEGELLTTPQGEQVPTQNEELRAALEKVKAARQAAQEEQRKRQEVEQEFATYRATVGRSVERTLSPQFLRS